ncbi:MAG: hypothetical protein ACRDD7_08805 [Peptostreptococcaceae bacterium]
MGLLLNIYISSVIACIVSLFFYIRRLYKYIEEFNKMDFASIVITFLLLIPPSFIPIANIFIGATWFINVFMDLDEFIYNMENAD